MTVRRILAASTAFGTDERGNRTVGPLVRAAIALSSDPRAPRIAYLGTAKGDKTEDAASVSTAFAKIGVAVQVVSLMPHPNVPQLRESLFAQDVIYVGGGSVAGLLALWRLHGLDLILREAWELGIVLTGYSAGSICWHHGGPTDSFGPELQVITNGLGFLPFGNAVHYDAEPQRRHLLHASVSDGLLPTSFATENGTALLYEGTDMVEVLADRPDATAYRIERQGHGVRETRLGARLLV